MHRIRSGRKVHPVVTILAVALILAMIALVSLPPTRERIHRHLLGFFDTVQGMPDWGPALVGAAFIPVCLLFLPGSPVTLFGGFAFGGTFTGLVRVTAAVSIGSTLGATLAFLIGRYFARGWIERRVAARPRFRAIDEAVGRAGFRIVLLARLSPVFPFNLLNYGFGITGVSLRDYVLGSWIGMLPGTIVYVYLGSTMRQLAEVFSGRARQSPAQQGLFYLGLLATLIVVVVIARVARKALQTAIPDRTGDVRNAGR
ncbi:MAG TPA: TVP38/TMEM64 family protein [Planctomycetaceae bacterium]|jgi:uncharacterized membrane protein YdjX (TVP38/TMEM64 family)|nr:TVP38/TMEM64 family protein [Planctomycetaceae bacterium]